MWRNVNTHFPKQYFLQLLLMSFFPYSSTECHFAKFAYMPAMTALTVPYSKWKQTYKCHGVAFLLLAVVELLFQTVSWITLSAEIRAPNPWHCLAWYCLILATHLKSVPATLQHNVLSVEPSVCSVPGILHWVTSTGQEAGSSFIAHHITAWLLELLPNTRTFICPFFQNAGNFLAGRQDYLAIMCGKMIESLGDLLLAGRPLCCKGCP